MLSWCFSIVEERATLTSSSAQKLVFFGFALANVFFAGCSEQTNFFPDDALPGGRAGTGGQAGSSSSGGDTATSGGVAGAVAGSGATTGGSAQAGVGAGAGVGSTGGTTGSGGDVAQGGRSGDGSAGDPTHAGEAGDDTAGSGASGGNAGSGNDGGGGSGNPDGGTAGAGNAGSGNAGGSDAGSGNAGGSSATGGTAGAGNAGSGGEAGASCAGQAESCNGIDDDCNDAVDEGGVCPTGCSAKSRAGHLYLLCLDQDESEQTTYEAARLRCEGLTSALELNLSFALARIESESENEFSKDWIKARTSVASGTIWMGANDLETERTWVWNDDPASARFFNERESGGGSAYMDRFNDFASGRPNHTNGSDEDCGAFDAELSWQWNDIRCGIVRLGYLCEQTP